MSFLPYPPNNATEAISVFSQDIQIAHDIIHGDNTQQVDTEGGIVPTFAKVIKTLTDEVNAATGVDVSLRSDLANPASTVNIGGTQAKIIANAALMAVYPENFYQTSDGADMSLCINRAVRYLQGIGGGHILYRSGVYPLYRAIRLDTYDPETMVWNHASVLSNIHHVGAGKGATILRSMNFWTSCFTSFPEPFLDAAAKSEDVTGNNISISDMTIDGNYNSIVDGGATYGANYNTYTGVWPDGTSDNATWAADNYQYPIYAWNTDNFTVQNCEIKNSWFNGVQIYRCTNVRVLNNDIVHCGDKANYLGYYSGIEFDNGTIRGQVEGNTIQDCGNGFMSNGDPLPYARSAVRNIKILGNTFANIVKSGIYAFDWIEGWVIADNDFEELGNSGIELLNGGGADLSRKPSFNTIDNNTIKNFNKSNTTGLVGIRCYGHNNNVTNNRVYQNRLEVTNETYGIVIDSTGGLILSGAMTIRNSVVGNTVSGKFPSSGNGSHISITAANTVVQDNECIAWGSVSSQAIRTDGNYISVIDNKIVGTYARNSGKRPIWHVNGTGFELRDNKYEPYLNIVTGAGLGGKSGWNVVDFNAATSTQTDARDNFNEGTNAFVADIAGVYEFNAIAGFGGLGTNDNCFALFERNGAVSFGGVSLRINTDGILSPYALITLNAGDSVTLKMYTSGTSYSIEAGTTMSVKYIRPN